MHIHQCPVSKADTLQNRVTLIQGICSKSIGKSIWRRKTGTVIYLWIPIESKGKFCYPDFTSTVLLGQLELCYCCRCWNHHYQCVPGSKVRACLLIPRAQESTVPLKLLYLTRAAKASSHLWWWLLLCNCSTTAIVSSPEGQIPRVLYCRSCWSTIAEIASVRSQRGKKIISLIFCQCFQLWQNNLGNVVFRFHHRKKAWKGWEWSW